MRRFCQAVRRRADPQGEKKFEADGRVSRVSKIPETGTLPQPPIVVIAPLFAAAMFVLAQGSAMAQSGNPLESPPCREAIESLQKYEDAARVRSAPDRPDRGRPRGAPDPRLEALRRSAAQACLASRPDLPAPPQRFAQPPLGVAPAAAVAPVPAPKSASPIDRPRPPIKPIDPPAFVTSCDAVGCWASDGSRLDRVGPNLLGSRGLCTLQGALLQCP